MSVLFDSFRTFGHVTAGGVKVHGRIGHTGGQARGGPPLLLLHGHPQTHAMWHRVAPALAARHTVVALDLRGYGDSARPAAADADADPAWGAKRTMAADAHAAMSSLGFARYAVAAHDRGARVAHRLALDMPQAVSRLMLLDIAPTLAMYEGTTEEFARRYWHWFFLIQPAPLPERLIEADPVAYLRDVMGRRHAGLAAFAPEALAEYQRCIATPGSAAGICADYRASAGIDLEHDRADRASGRLLEQPLRVLWGAKGVVGACFDVMSLWHAAARHATGRALDCGHYIAEERPDELLAEMHAFFGEDTD
jgi:haloacetate dehalogenase